MALAVRGENWSVSVAVVDDAKTAPMAATAKSGVGLGLVSVAQSAYAAPFLAVLQLLPFRRRHAHWIFPPAQLSFRLTSHWYWYR